MEIMKLRMDVTPPIGAKMTYGSNQKIDTPIYIRAVVIDDQDSRAVILSCDYTLVWGDTWLDWREAVAKAANTSPERVFLHCVHQHDSMFLATQLNEYLKEKDSEIISDKYCTKTINNLCFKISSLINEKSSWHKVSKLLTAEKRVKGLAANRRMIDDQGKCFAMRWSYCGDETVRALPTGLIDPMLKTIAFAGDDGKIIAALHFYASHPMAAYKRDMVSQDVPGAAQEYLAANSAPETLNIYFTGCGGNVTFGKYNTGEPAERIQKLGTLLGKNMLSNLERLEETDVGKLKFVNASFDFPLKEEINEEAIMQKISEGSSAADNALHLVIAKNWEKWRKCELSRMSIGDKVHFLSLPGEMCVEYQLYAQELVPDEFLACAAYGNCTYHYIPTAKMYEEGGYEPEVGSISTKDVEIPLKKAIAEALKDLR